MSGPLVSILIPTYNGERFLRSTLRSAVEQSYKDLEILVGDDASTDRTPEILSAAAASDERIRVLSHPTNLGPYENPLSLLRAARGEYIKFLLHDDVLATDCVRDLVRGMQSAPDVSMAFSRRSLINEDGRPVPGHEFPQLTDRPGLIQGRELGDAMLESCTNVIGEFSTVLFRRDALTEADPWQIDGRRLDAVTDVKVWLQLLARGPAFYTPRTLSRFRVHSGQNTWNPRFLSRGERDWVRMIDWGFRLGFLQDEAKLRRAYGQVLQLAAARAAGLLAGPDHGAALEAVFLATAALVELGSGRTADAEQGLDTRAHEPALLGRFAQGVDVWTRRYPVALAAPALDAEEMSATVRALRAIAAEGVAEKLVIAVPQQVLQDAVPLVEAALAEGPDVDVELIPSDEPARVLAEPWLAVGPGSCAWHQGRATAVWNTDAVATVREAVLA